MQILSKKKKGVVTAFQKGYKVIGNDVIFNGNVRKLDIREKKGNGVNTYASFGIRGEDGKRVQIFVHHLVAYQKFGKKWLEDESLVIIHKDKNTLNNHPDNIILGTRQDTSDLRHGIKFKENPINF
jgi:hypothetical protein